MMRFYSGQHRHYCGVDLHTKRMYLCILDQAGNKVLHRNMRAKPHDFLSAIEGFRDDLVVGAECMFTWYWLADLCLEEKIQFVLGHALYVKAIHGGKKKDDKLDSEKIARLIRGGTFPLSYVYPREMRATRDPPRPNSRSTWNRPIVTVGDGPDRDGGADWSSCPAPTPFGVH